MRTRFKPTASGTSVLNIVERVTVRVPMSYEALRSAFESEVGRWSPDVGDNLVARHAPWSEVTKQITPLGGKHGLMILYTADQGRIASLAGSTVQSALYLVGNPVIAAGIIKTDLRAGMLVPFRVEISHDGAASLLSYELPSSSLATLKQPELVRVGDDLDSKMSAVTAAILSLVGDRAA